MDSEMTSSRVLADRRTGRRRGGRRLPILVGRGLVILGLLSLIAFTADFALGLWQQQQLNETWHRQQLAAAATAPPARGGEHSTGPAIDPRPVDGVDFGLRVPRIGYEAAVAEGTDANVLAGGPGHYPEMAWPGQRGNVGVAAHNVYWIQFNDLQPGDRIVLQSRWGDYTYQVTAKRIVMPDDRTVLVQTGPPRLTLTTCWPLWAGAFANQRLVIFADQVDPSPSPAQAS
jgi:LPXTG-site transpeptidase (sortase) family protein